MSQKEADRDFITRLKKQPRLLARMEALLSVVENAGNDLKKASEAEQRVIEEVRQLGQEALQGWAATRIEQMSEEANKTAGIRRAGKKNSVGTARSGSSK